MTAPYAERVHVWCLTDTVWLPGDGPRRIQLRRTRGWRKPAGAVSVARPSRWGNPFQVWRYPGHAGWWADVLHDDLTHTDPQIFATRAEAHTAAVDSFRRALASINWCSILDRMPHISLLAGRDLACWCPLLDVDGDPLPCHADVLLELANAPR